MSFEAINMANYTLFYILCGICMHMGVVLALGHMLVMSDITVLTPAARIPKMHFWSSSDLHAFGDKSSDSPLV